MIKKISIKNFKTHKDTEIEFGPGMNAIVGKSQSGKSNILKAFKWLTKNTPSTGKILTDTLKSAGDVSVSTEFDDCFIKMIKTVNKDHKANKKIVKRAIYTVNDTEYSSIGKNIPDVAIDMINMDDVNFQYQKEMDYLIGESSGAIAKKINAITGIEKADKWIESINKKYRSSKQQIRNIEEEVSKTSESLKKFEALPDIQKMIENSEVLTNQSILVENKRDILALFAYKASKIKAKIRIQDETKTTVEALLEKFTMVNTDHVMVNSTKDLIHDYIVTDDNIKFIKEIISSITAMVENAESYIDYYIGIEDKIELIEKYTDSVNTVHGIAMDIEDLKSNLRDLYKEANLCPFCHSKITEKKIKELVDELCIDI